MTFAEKVNQWLQSGADYDAGLQLYVQAVGKGHPTIYILRKKKQTNYQLLVKSLCHRAGVPEPNKKQNANRHHQNAKSEQQKAESKSQTAKSKPLRQDYTFLSEPGTPNELKILVSNKITAYNEYKAAHAKLFDNLPPEEEYANVRTLVENYIENHTIHQELAHYQQTRTILGKHPIFEEIKRLKKYRHTNSVELFKQKKRVEHNIWRIKKLIDSGDKPHLRVERLAKIKSYELELAEIKKVIGE